MFSLKLTINLVSTAALSMLVWGAAIPEANATVSDYKIFSQYQSRKTELLSEEQLLQKDLDILQRQIDELSKQKDASLSKQLNDLSRSFNDTYYDLKEVQQHLRDLDLRML